MSACLELMTDLSHPNSHPNAVPVLPHVHTTPKRHVHNAPPGHPPYTAKITDTEDGLLIETYKPKCLIKTTAEPQLFRPVLSSPKHAGTASNATQELDDLMASLSDFKVDIN